MANDQRILALLRGEPLVGMPCPHDTTDHALHVAGSIYQWKCNGTGRINTEPANEVERAVADKIAWFKNELHLNQKAWAKDRGEWREALEAERAAHQATRERYAESRRVMRLLLIDVRATIKAGDTALEWANDRTEKPPPGHKRLDQMLRRLEERIGDFVSSWAARSFSS